MAERRLVAFALQRLHTKLSNEPNQLTVLMNYSCGLPSLKVGNERESCARAASPLAVPKISRKKRQTAVETEPLGVGRGGSHGRINFKRRQVAFLGAVGKIGRRAPNSVKLQDQGWARDTTKPTTYMANRRRGITNFSRLGPEQKIKYLIDDM